MNKKERLDMNKKDWSGSDEQETVRKQGLKPGEGFPMGYVKWRKEDLDATDVVTFIPQEIPNLRYHEADGVKFIIFHVNELACLFTLHQLNTVNRMFYNAYNDSLQGALEVERLKRTGLPDMPWEKGFPGKNKNEWVNTWTYIPEAPTAWLTENGGSLLSDEYYVVSQEEGTKGMPVSLGKTKDLIEAGTHPGYKHPPQQISYKIGFSVLFTALKQTLKNVWNAIS